MSLDHLENVCRLMESNTLSLAQAFQDAHGRIDQGLSELTVSGLLRICAMNNIEARFKYLGEEQP
jgi:hypothetical protein